MKGQIVLLVSLLVGTAAFAADDQTLAALDALFAPRCKIDRFWQCQATDQSTDSLGKKRVFTARHTGSEPKARKEATDLCRRLSRQPRLCAALECEKAAEQLCERSPRVASAETFQCVTDGDCSGSQVCVSGRCLQKDAAENRCASDAQCGYPSRCVDGKCL